MAWAPVVEKEVGDQRSNKPDPLRVEVTGGRSMSRNPSDFFAQALSTKRTVTDYRPTCECGVCNVCGGSGQKEGAVSGVIASCPVCAGTGQKKTQHEPGIVLDIFGGSGTTGMVAKQLMRRWVVMDISRPYLDEQAKVRTGSGTPANALDGLPMFEE